MVHIWILNYPQISSRCRLLYISIGVIKDIPAGYLLAVQNLDLSSDHSPILVTLSSKIILTQSPAILGNKKTKWDFFLNIPLKTANDIDEAVENVTNTIQEGSSLGSKSEHCRRNDSTTK